MAATLEFRLTGGASNSDPDASLGGTMSSVSLSETALNNLFDNVSSGEAASGDVEYRAISIYNSGASSTKSVELWIENETHSDHSKIDVGKDSTTQLISDEGTAPDDVIFFHPLTGSRMSIDNISSGSEQRIWVRRTITSGAVNWLNDTAQLKVEYY